MVLAVVLNCQPRGTSGGDNALSANYRVQILHLAPHLDLPEPADLSRPRLVLPSREREPVSPPHPPARQTLIVNGASPKLKLKRLLPLPAVISRSANRPLPAHLQQVRTDGPAALRLAPQTLNPALSPLPMVSVISLPDRSLLAPEATSIPVVSQAAAPSGLSQGRSLPHGGLSPEGSSTLAETPGQPGTGARERPPDKTLTRIELPQNGRPQMSVFGESVAEQYPETADQMRGLVVSTIYLGMGLKKSWTLEYWMPAGEEIPAQKGGAAGLVAPWPYLMFRPDVALPPEADAVLVRGALTAEGRLEGLALLLPAEWAQRDSLFQALRQWKFRPASRNGQPQSVEVLLVIPRQPDE
jgi:hypothetical protein